MVIQCVRTKCAELHWLLSNKAHASAWPHQVCQYEFNPGRHVSGINNSPKWFQQRTLASWNLSLVKSHTKVVAKCAVITWNSAHLVLVTTSSRFPGWTRLLIGPAEISYFQVGTKNICLGMLLSFGDSTRTSVFSTTSPIVNATSTTMLGARYFIRGTGKQFLS